MTRAARRAGAAWRPVAGALALVLALAPPARPAAPAAARTVFQVHLAFAPDEGQTPADSILVTWRAADSGPGRVEVEGHGAPVGAVEAARRPLPEGGSLRVALVTGLHPATRYRYAIAGPDGTPSFTSSFATTNGLPLTFTASADIGVTPFTRAVIARAAALRPAFHLACGDLSYANAADAPVPESIDRFMETIEPLASAAAFMPVWGNHEYTRPDRVGNYLARFALPGNGKWYSFDAGPAHVVMLTSRMEPFGDGSAQRAWLERDLAAASRNPAVGWTVVCFHHPPFSSGLVHGSDLPTRRAWSPLFDRYGVDLVLTGHDHAYERTYPVTADGVVRARGDEFTNPGAPVYVVTGGGGESVYGLRRSRPDWSAARIGAYHVSRVTIEPLAGGASRLVFEMVRPNGEVGDRFVIVKRR